MTDRLLNDEEIASYLLPAGYIGIYAITELAQAQDSKTLKAVGEWLEKMGAKGYIREMPSAIDQLKQGKMPE